MMKLNLIRFMSLLAIGALLAAKTQATELTLSLPGKLRTNYTGAFSILVPKFNPALGPLQSITLNIIPEVSSLIQGLGTGPSNTANGWAAGSSGTLRVTGPSFVSRDIGFGFGDQGGTIFQPGTPVVGNFGPGSFPTAISMTANLSGYIGTGSTSLTLSRTVLNNVLFFSRSGFTTSSTNDIGYRGTVTYSYQTAAPEPGTFVLLGLGVFTLLSKKSRLRTKSE
jgi:PEP-CTERM motif